jgi:hypothetical protein
MIRPPRPLPAQYARGGAVEEEGGLEVDVMLEIPVLLRHLVDARPADEHGGRLDQHVEAAEGLDDALEHRLVLVDPPEVHADGEMRTALEAGDHRIDRRLVDVDGGDPRAGRGEGSDDLAPDPAGGAGDHDALALEPGAHRPRHRLSPSPMLRTARPAAPLSCAPRRSTTAPRR